MIACFSGYGYAGIPAVLGLKRRQKTHATVVLSLWTHQSVMKGRHASHILPGV